MMCCNNDEIVIYLTRHGKTMFNATGQLQGWCDTPLIQEGIDAAVNLGKKLKKAGLKIDAVYSGDLNRQRMTAKYIMEQLDIPYRDLNENPGLREVCFGSCEGLDIKTVLPPPEKSESPFALRGLSAALEKVISKDTLGLAESVDAASVRIMKAVDKITAEARSNGFHHILAVTSGMIINILLGTISGMTYGQIGNCSITKIVNNKNGYTVESIGITDF